MNNSSEQLIGKHPRIEAVDALRGFAVMAILLVHNLEHFIFPVYPADSPGWLNTLDQGVFNVVFTLFAGKAYAIFALLFGFTFYIQSDNLKRRGGDFGYRFLWRLVLLAGFATLNAAFFPAGDVLLLFVVAGLVLFFTRNWGDGAILAAAVVFLLQPVEWYHCIAALLNPAHRLPDLGVGEMYARVAEYTKAGNFGDFILGNVTLGQKASLLWAVNAGRFVQTAGLFLLGFYIGRKQLFAATEKNLRFWVKTLIVSAIAFAPLYTLKELVTDNGARHVAEAGFYAGLGRFVHPALPAQEVQCRRCRSALLRQDEPYELPLPIRHRGLRLFPVRPLPCPSVRIYGQPVGRDSGVPAAGAVLQMVAGEAQTGAAGIYLA